MKVTIALLIVYVLTLVIEALIWLYLLIKPYGAGFAIEASAIEAIFVELMIVLIFCGGRGMRWSYVGAIVPLHSIFDQVPWAQSRQRRRLPRPA